jgi:hypothetical protein
VNAPGRIPIERVLRREHSLGLCSPIGEEGSAPLQGPIGRSEGSALSWRACCFSWDARRSPRRAGPASPDPRSAEPRSPDPRSHTSSSFSRRTTASTISSEGSAWRLRTVINRAMGPRRAWRTTGSASRYGRSQTSPRTSPTRGTGAHGDGPREDGRLQPDHGVLGQKALSVLHAVVPVPDSEPVGPGRALRRCRSHLRGLPDPLVGQPHGARILIPGWVSRREPDHLAIHVAQGTELGVRQLSGRPMVEWPHVDRRALVHPRPKGEGPVPGFSREVRPDHLRPAPIGGTHVEDLRGVGGA